MSPTVVAVDLQRDFLDKASGSHVARWEKAFCVPNVRQLMAFARQEAWPVIHVGTRHASAASLPYHHRLRGDKPWCVEGTSGAEFIVEPEAGEAVLYKTWYSAFGSGLEDFVSEGDTVIWAGVATDCCIQQSAFDADRREIKSVIPIQAVCCSTNQSFSASLTTLAKSVANVVELAAVYGGGDIAAEAIVPADVSRRAEAWFNGQAELLGTPVEGTTLDEVLRRLSDRPVTE